jgi:hypothetical protein
VFVMLAAGLAMAQSPKYKVGKPATAGDIAQRDHFVSPDGKGLRPRSRFARFTNLPVSARHKDVLVWSFEESPAEDAFGGFDKRYNSVHAVEGLPAVRDE